MFHALLFTLIYHSNIKQQVLIEKTLNIDIQTRSKHTDCTCFFSRLPLLHVK